MPEKVVYRKTLFGLFALTAWAQFLIVPVSNGAELPMVRMAHAAFNEKVAGC
jgi:hypothetical protein